MLIVAKSESARQTLQFALAEGEVIRLGRAPRHGIAVPWDMLISREHAELLLENGSVKVSCLKTARNPIEFNGESSGEFQLELGERFRIGATWFHYVGVEYSADQKVSRRSFKPDELKKIKFGDETRRLELLTQLPRMISVAKSEADFATSLTALLLEGIPNAEAVAVIAYENEDVAGEMDHPRLMSWDSRTDDIGRFRPSRRLIRESLERGESLIYFWPETDSGDSQYTLTYGLDWAFCTPLDAESCKGWCLYVSGNSEGGSEKEQEMLGDLRFTELLAQVLGAIRELRFLQQRQAEMSQYFSPAVMETLSDQTAEQILVPRESEITVLFCDVRGFSRKAERSRHRLFDLLNRVSDALGIMTREIMKYEGVIADFQGDAALAFWGWPAACDDGPMSACLAALSMYQEFTSAIQAERSSLAGFRVGIGIGHGRAIAGRIGTEEQVKVGVFGPVVNLASRLEAMTKQFRVPIIIDEETANYLTEHMPPEVGRHRRLACVRPHGMQTPLMVHELLPPQGKYSLISDDGLVLHETAVNKFIEGQWDEAVAIMDELPTVDRAKLLPLVHMAQHDFEPPEGWDGIINLTTK